MTMSGSYMLGNFITGRTSLSLGAERLAAIGNLLSLAGVSAGRPPRSCFSGRRRCSSCR